MEDHDIKSYIDIILSKELSSLKNRTLTWKVKENGDIEYEHAETLINMFLSISDEQKITFFCSNMLSDIEFGSEIFLGRDDSSYKPIFISSSGLSLYTMIILGYVDQAINALINRLNRRELYSFGILSILFSMVDGNNNPFNINQIAKLIQFSKDYYDSSNNLQNEYINTIIHTLSHKGYDIIKNQIGKINIEINRDKEAVLQKIRFLNFDDKYNDFLNELDNFLLSSNTAVTSGMIGSFRSFMEDLLTDMANKIAESKNEEIPQFKDCKKMGNIRNYLQNKLELSSADNNLINKYIDVLHSEGGHSFTSNKEYFRLARNIGIEIVLLLLTKYDNLFNEKL